MSVKKNQVEVVSDETEDVSAFVEEAERGYDVEKILRRRIGRPAMGEGPSSVESVRLDPELKKMLILRAAERRISVSAAIREALREYVTS